MTHVTPSQLSVIEAVRAFRRKWGYSPTLEEIADALDLSKPTVQGHVRALCDKKVLRKRRYEHRSLEIVEAALPGSARPHALPLLGRVAAGRPIEALEDKEVVDIGELLSLDDPRRSLYLLRVVGDSMVDDGIFDGDYVVIEPRQTAENGETVVALLNDGSATLKRFYREKKRIRLQPANAKLRPIYVREVSIRGVVRGVVRSL